MENQTCDVFWFSKSTGSPKSRLMDNRQYAHLTGSRESFDGESDYTVCNVCFLFTKSTCSWESFDGESVYNVFAFVFYSLKELVHGCH